MIKIELLMDGFVNEECSFQVTQEQRVILKPTVEMQGMLFIVIF